MAPDTPQNCGHDRDLAERGAETPRSQPMDGRANDYSKSQRVGEDVNAASTNPKTRVGRTRKKVLSGSVP